MPMTKTRPIILTPEGLEAWKRRQAASYAEVARKVAKDNVLRQQAFEATPLITRKRLYSSPREIFEDIAKCPPFVGSILLMSTNPDDENDARMMETTIWSRGLYVTKTKTVTRATALLFEICRAGHSFAGNSNHSKRSNPQAYLKAVFHGAPEDNMPASRILFGAEPGEAVKTLWQDHDLSPENLYVVGDAHAKKAAREVTMRHVERLVTERLIAGTWPNSCAAEDYLTNLRLLFRLLDESVGRLPDVTES